MSFEHFTEKRQKLIKLLETKYKICKNPVVKDGYLRQLNHLSEELSFARPDTPADTEERRRILETYADTIRNTITDENPLWFHGVRHLASLEKILSSGHLGYLEEEESRSLTVLRISRGLIEPIPPLGIFLTSLHTSSCR